MDTNNLNRLTAPGIEVWMEEEAEKMLAKSMYSKIFNVETTNRLFEDDSSIARMGFLEEVSENDAAPEETDLLGYEWRYQQKIYAKSKTISDLIKRTDLYSKASPEDNARSLSKMAVVSRDAYAFGVFRKAFDNTVLYGDGKPLISVAHPRKDGGTAQRNTFLDGVQRALSYDNLKLLEDVMGNWFDNKGFPILSAGKIALLITPYNRETALQIAEATGTPDTADNSVNYWKGRNMDVMEVEYFAWKFAKALNETASTDRETYDKRYFLVNVDYAKQVLKFKQLMSPDSKAWQDNATRRWYANIFDIYAVGISDWKFVAGSLGDGTTYTY